MIVRTIIFLLLLQLCSTEKVKILVTAPFQGSHYFAIGDLGVMLAGQGYSVKFVSMIRDERYRGEHPNFTIVPPVVELMTAKDFDDIAEKCIRAIIDSGRDYFLFSDTMMRNTQCFEGWRKIYRDLSKFYTSEPFLALLEKEKFDLIIAEDRTLLPVLAASNKHGTPLIGYIPEVTYLQPRELLNLPFLLASEPSMALQVLGGQKPGFWYRLEGLYETVVGGYNMKIMIDSALEDAYKQLNVTSSEDLQQRIQMFFINDYTPYSFPFQIPSNVIQVGPQSYSKPLPLKGPLKEFVDRQTQRIIVVSTGSYVELTWNKWYKDLLEVLIYMGYPVIVKVRSEYVHLVKDLPGNFYVSSWLPQRDLLASGVVKFLISNCGNNAKMEAIYYKTPIFCTPVFAEQAMNGEIVEYRGFGGMLLPGMINKISMKTALEKMTQNEVIHKENMQNARDMVEMDPVNHQDRIIYFIKLLIKHGNLSYLKNRIIKDQSSLELYHLDIIAFVSTVIVISMIILLKMISFTCSKLWNIKKETKLD